MQLTVELGRQLNNTLPRHNHHFRFNEAEDHMKINIILGRASGGSL